MEFCFDLINCPIQLLLKETETPPEIEHGDVVEITKYNGVSTIRHGEAFFISPKKSIHISFLNGTRYLTIFDNRHVTKYTDVDSVLNSENYPNYYIPQSIAEIQSIEITVFGESATRSSSINISRPKHRLQVHSAPV